ncbi:MAG TPA: sulfatase-like hydrolase/transferase [Fimbriimonadaceae bacterium]|nr:sulfatase-like hydrolase/transferase [Fimbriimonadaceae bacterium]
MTASEQSKAKGNPWRRLALCISLANLLFIEAWVLLNFNFLDYRLHTPLATLYFEVILDAVVLGCAFFLIDALLARTRWQRQIRGFVLVAATLFILRTLNSTLGYRWLSLPASLFGAPGPQRTVLTGLVVIAVVLAIYFLSRVGWIVRTLRTLLLAFSPFILINVALATLALSKNASYRDLPPIQAAPSKPGPRVVWILMDTLDYHYAFESPPSWLRLPNFDRLRNESVDFTYALAPGSRTEISIPGLFTGVQFKNQSIVSTGDFDMTRLDGVHCHFRGMDTVFRDAEEMGARSAVLGIHLPYGRLLGDQTSYCRWWQWPDQFPSGESWLHSSLDDFTFLMRERQKGEQSVERQLRSHEQEIAEASALAADPRYRLEYFHLFPPHLPCMFDARTGSPDVDSQWNADPYENSLAFADRALGEIRRSMEAAGTWDTSLVILTADHSFRVGGELGYKVYPRIPFLCHLPKQTARVAVGDKINTICTHDMLLAYLDGQLRTPQELAGWVVEWIRNHPKVPLTDIPPGPVSHGDLGANLGFVADRSPVRTGN